MKTSLKFSLGILILVALPMWGALLLVPGKPDRLTFTPGEFADLPGWNDGEVAGALAALEKTCAKLRSLPPGRSLPGADIGGTAGDWIGVCDLLPTGDGVSEAAARHYFENNFQPLAVSIGDRSTGTFTGYYEPLLKGSPVKTDEYSTPILGKPDDLVMVDLGQFRDDLKGRRVAGSVQNGRLVPYADRATIADGALADRAQPLLYVDSPVDAFFLHIQGSGRVRMPDGRLQMVGYAAQNGHAYTSVGRVLIQSGAIARENMSMQAIRSWFQANPDRAHDIMNKNRSYVFFRFLEGTDGPYGSANVPLTAGHSLAVDRSHLSLHTPMWLAATYPDPDRAFAPSDKKDADSSGQLPLRRMMVAQDTGGAIAGEIRGDVFWGFGDRAEEIAGRMANQGSYWVLLPKPLAAQKTANAG
ncbi:membrane-bound lytic murein transglycosylase A [Kordiimonas sediminis]|uniref:peptidoglycan lytic exotransglycosylase n=1 Tax=Kordiimonas sediminis TaxID=1735581 RepID=A0A919AMK7_9PROT|nr:MltA domain-containing protein [Kordiimonas sediminis]GHF15262.1 membrane-bound lytic murein transglycosylase A [Kordiimonas sediminis]